MFSFESFVSSIFSFVSRLFTTLYNLMVFPHRMYRNVLLSRVEHYVDPRIFLAVILITCSINPVLSRYSTFSLDDEDENIPMTELYTTAFKTLTSNENILLFDIPIVLCCTAFLAAVSKIVLLSSRYQKIYVSVGLYTTALIILVLNIILGVSRVLKINSGMLLLLVIPVFLFIIGYSTSILGFHSRLWWKFMSLILSIPAFIVALIWVTEFYLSLSNSKIEKHIMLVPGISNRTIDVLSQYIDGTDSAELSMKVEFHNLLPSRSYIENDLRITFGGGSFFMSAVDEADKFVLEGYTIKTVSMYVKIDTVLAKRFNEIRLKNGNIKALIFYYNFSKSSDPLYYFAPLEDRAGRPIYDY